MKLLRTDHGFIIILDQGEKVIESLKRICEEKKIHGFFLGIGAVRTPEIGYFDLNKREYIRKALDGEYEVISLLGNISRDKEGKAIVHAHISLGDRNYRVLGGHLFKADDSVTLEISVFSTPAIVRAIDEFTGLKLITELK